MVHRDGHGDRRRLGESSRSSSRRALAERRRGRTQACARLRKFCASRCAAPRHGVRLRAVLGGGAPAAARVAAVARRVRERRRRARLRQLENFQLGVPAAQAPPFQPTATPAVPCALGLPAAIATPTTPAAAPASSDFLHSRSSPTPTTRARARSTAASWSRSAARGPSATAASRLHSALGHVGPTNSSSGKRRTRGQPDYRERADAAVAAAPAAPPPPNDDDDESSSSSSGLGHGSDEEEARPLKERRRCRAPPERRRRRRARRRRRPRSSRPSDAAWPCGAAGPDRRRLPVDGGDLCAARRRRRVQRAARPAPTDNPRAASYRAALAENGGRRRDAGAGASRQRRRQ